MLNTKMNFFEQIFYAVIKPKQYYRLTKVSGGRLTGFVFLFTFIISLFTVLPMLNSTIGPSGFLRTFQKDLPAFELSNGELYVNERFENVEDNVYVLIDSNVERFEYEDINKDYNQVVLVSRTNCINYQSYGRLQELKFADLRGFHFDNDALAALISFVYPLLFFVVMLLYLFIVAAYYVTALLYSLIGLFVSSISHANLTYATIFKTAIYSKVTIRILYALLGVTNLELPGYLRNSIAIFATGAYVVFGILSHTSDDAYEEAGLAIPPR